MDFIRNICFEFLLLPTEPKIPTLLLFVGPSLIIQTCLLFYAYTKYLQCDCCFRQLLVFFTILFCSMFRIEYLLILFKHAINASNTGLRIAAIRMKFFSLHLNSRQNIVYIWNLCCIDWTIFRVEKKFECRSKSVTWRNKNLCRVFRCNKTLHRKRKRGKKSGNKIVCVTEIHVIIVYLFECTFPMYVCDFILYLFLFPR